MLTKKVFSLSVDVKNPLIKVPSATDPKNHILVDLGHTRISNSIHSPFSHLILSNMLVSITDMKLCLPNQGDLKPILRCNEIRANLVVPLKDIEQKFPSVLVNSNLPGIIAEIDKSSLEMIMNILDSNFLAELSSVSSGKISFMISS